jgi:serine/threonine protein kinase/WD40 repeat protein/Flp pilus assembly protein TadD
MPESSEARDVLLNRLADEFAARQRAGERPRLEDYCDRHPDLAADIRSLFPALVELERVKADAGTDLAVEAAEAPPVTTLGDFRLLREVGRGGMGVVYEAEQVSLGRRVALKLLPASVFRDPVKRRRFEREAKAAARLHHTNIVPVHGFGEHDGTPYYVMQFIPGLGLDAVIDELALSPGRTPEPNRPPASERTALSAALARSLLEGDAAGTLGCAPEAGDSPTGTTSGGATPDPAPPARPARGPSASPSASGLHLPGQSGSGVGGSSGRKTTYWESVARIGVQVAGALAYAHRLGVLHRDIKPSNLLLDLDGIVWVTDFGLAKADDSDNLTHTGDLLGTLRYMSPEAFEGRADARSDVYGLGLTLFELVALRPAYEERERHKLIKQVTAGEPPRLRKLRPDAPRDLVTIVEKATDKDPARRYQSAAAMADDLQRFLDGRPITARRATELEKLWMWARRRPAIAGLVAALFLCLLVGSVVSTVFWVRADRFARDAALREKDATAARDAAREARNAAARQAAGLLLDRGIEDARGGEPARALHLFVRALRAIPADDPQAAPLERAIRANLSAWAETVPALEHIWPGGIPYEDVAFSPEGERIALTVGKDEIQCFRTDTGRPVGPSVKIPEGVCEAMVFAPDARSLWVASPGNHTFDAQQWAIHRFDPVSGRLGQSPIPTTGPVQKLIPTPDGQYLVGAVLGLHPEDRGPAANADRTRKWRTASIMVWDTVGGRVVRKVDVNAEHYASSFLGLSPDGKSVTAWVQSQSNTIEGMTFTVNGNEPPISLGLRPLEPGTPFTLNFQNNLRTALVIKDGQVHRWSVTNAGGLGPGFPAPFRMMYNEPAPDGRTVISLDEGRAFDIGAWPPRRSGVRFAHPGWLHEVFVSTAYHGLFSNEQFSSDGRFIATWPVYHGGNDRRLWRLPHPHSRTPLPLTELARLPERTKHFHFARLDLRGTGAILWWVQGVDDTHNVRVVDVTTGAVRGTSVRHSERVRVVEFAPDGRYFATASHDGTARVWETATGRPAGPALRHRNWVADVAFSPDGNTLAAGDYGPAGLIKLWDWRTGKEVRPPLQHDDIVINVSFSPDGRYVAALKALDWSKKPELIVWEVGSGTAVIRVPHRYALHRFVQINTAVGGFKAQFRPDGRAVAALDANGLLRLWEVPSGKLLGERPLDGATVTRFSPHGRVIAAAANLGVRLLDAQNLEPLPGGYLPHPDPVEDLAFSPDGAFLLTGRREGSAQLWDVATRKPVGPPAVLIGAIHAVTFTPDGKTCVCVAADGTVRRWPVPAPFAEPDLDRLADRVALMTGQRMDSNQGLDHVPADEWRTLRANLVGDASTALVPARPDADWHDAVAADAEQDGDAFGAEWHLDRLAALRPDDWSIPARRGRVLAAAGRRHEADAAYATATRLAPSPQVLSDWLRVAAADDEAAGRKESALWNLDRAVALTPGDWTLYALRADLADPARAVADFDEAIRRGAEPGIIVRAAIRAAESGDWKRSAALFNGLARNPALSTQGRYVQAVANLKAGDAAGYRAACAGIATRLPPVGPKLVPAEANTAAMAFALGPNATDDWAKPLAWIDHALARLDAAEKANPDNKDDLRRARHAFLNTRGAVLFRAGRFEEAAKVLREGMNLHPDGGEFHDWLFLALAEHRLGHADAATEAAAKARAVQARSKPGTVWDRAEVELLAAELDAALPPMGK